MVDPHVLSTRLNALEGYLAELRPFESYSREQFIKQPELHHLAERILHLACECVIDTAYHVISDLGFRHPTSYRDAIEVLQNESIIDEALAERLKGWMGFRNVLVHFYIDIDHGQSYDAIVEELGDLQQFGARMALLLDR